MVNRKLAADITEADRKDWEAENKDGVVGNTHVIEKAAGNSRDILDFSSHVELPPEAIITLAEGVRVISQKWLAHQPPPSALIIAGGDIFNEKNIYTPEKKNKNNIQCWLKDGIWYWNKKGGEWLARYHKGEIEKYSTIRQIYEQNKGKDNNATMNTMGVAPVGWLNPEHDDIWVDGFGIVRSATKNEHGSMATLFIEGGESSVRGFLIWDEDGSIPFIVLDEK